MRENEPRPCLHVGVVPHERERHDSLILIRIGDELERHERITRSSGKPGSCTASRGKQSSKMPQVLTASATPSETREPREAQELSPAETLRRRARGALRERTTRQPQRHSKA